jgi:hypothetical protein
MLGFLIPLTGIALLPLLLENVGIYISGETWNASFPYVFFGGYSISLIYFIGNKLRRKVYITKLSLDKKMLLPFFYLLLGTIGLSLIVYLLFTMKTGSASGLFLLVPGIWMSIFYGLGVSKITDIIWLQNVANNNND